MGVEEGEIKSDIKNFGLEEIEGYSYVTKGDRQLLRAGKQSATLLKMFDLHGADPEIGFTRIAVIPEEQAYRKIGVSKLPSDNSVVIITFRGRRADRALRDASLSASFLMNRDKAREFVSRAEEDLGLVYETLEKVNGGPIKQYDGKPMDIRRGEEVEVYGD